MDKLFKTENRPLKILMYLVLMSVGIVVGLTVLFCVGILSFFVLMSTADQASYYADEINVGPIDYNSVLTKAENSGYEVSGPYTRLDKANLIDPGNIESLEKRFLGDFRISRVELYYDLNTYLDLEKDENNQTLVTLFNYSYYDDAGNIAPQIPSMFPEDSWMLKMLGLSLKLNETDSRDLLKKLKNEESKQKEKKQGFVSLPTKENLDFPTIYTYLNQSSTNTVIKSSMWNEEEFYRDGKKIGYVGFVIPETTIIKIHNSNKYSLYVSSSGFVRADIGMQRGSAGKKIPEKEYRMVYKGNVQKPGLVCRES